MSQTIWSVLVLKVQISLIKLQKIKNLIKTTIV